MTTADNSKRHLVLVCFLFFYYGQFLFSFLNHKLFCQVDPILFTYKPDLAELALIVLGVPKFFITHPILFPCLDAIAFFFPFFIGGYYLRFQRFSIALGIPFIVFFYLYLLLQSLLLQYSLESQIPYFLLSFLFISNREERFWQVVSLVRFVLLYVMFTAAVWKLARGSVFYAEEMQHLLIEQHVAHLTASKADLIAPLHTFLIAHPSLAQGLYGMATLLEFAFLIGFFTRKYDRWLLLLLIAFVLTDHMIMRLPYWSMLVSGIVLWTKRDSSPE